MSRPAPVIGSCHPYPPERLTLTEITRREAGEAVRERSWWARIRLVESPESLSEAPASFFHLGEKPQHGIG